MHLGYNLQNPLLYDFTFKKSICVNEDHKLQIKEILCFRGEKLVNLKNPRSPISVIIKNCFSAIQN